MIHIVKADIFCTYFILNAVVFFNILGTLVLINAAFLLNNYEAQAYMVKAVLFTLSFFILSVSLYSDANDSAVLNGFEGEAKNAQRRISGLWHDVNNSNFKNGHLIVSQHGKQVFTAHYLEFKGIPFVEHGTGVRELDTITVNVQVTQQIPGWTTTGIHTLTLSADGQYLVGEYLSGGEKGPLKFKKAGK
ncbi:hypothetical protein N474_06005 [Pseudoalteromonas luteoviolacea CPMOR-2]|nr:hypothetical protein N474_06005 [Pseudoalteromonas luteoviolacea CPMOR-2]